MNKLVPYVVLFLIAGTGAIHGQDWISPYPHDNEIGQYFTDPLFYPWTSEVEKMSYESQYFPYFGEDFFRDDMNPYEHGQDAIAAQRQRFESPFYPYFGDRFLGWAENSPAAGLKYQIPTQGDTMVTIVSQGMRGYQVFLDGNYIGTEGLSGDPIDGRFSFKVVGNQNHAIRVYDGQFNYPKTMFFQRGVPKIINVEPGTAVYV